MNWRLFRNVIYVETIREIEKIIFAKKKLIRAKEIFIEKSKLS